MRQSHWYLPIALVVLLALPAAARCQARPDAAPEAYTIEKVNANIAKYVGRDIVFQNVLMSGRNQKLALQGSSTRFRLSVCSTAGKWLYPASYVEGNLTFEISPAMAEKLADESLMATLNYRVNLTGRIQKVKNESSWNWTLAIYRIDFRDKDGKIVGTLKAEPPASP